LKSPDFTGISWTSCGSFYIRCFISFNATHEFKKSIQKTFSDHLDGFGRFAFYDSRQRVFEFKILQYAVHRRARDFSNGFDHPVFYGSSLEQKIDLDFRRRWFFLADDPIHADDERLFDAAMALNSQNGIAPRSALRLQSDFTK
jgi:hypothetical protein